MSGEHRDLRKRWTWLQKAVAAVLYDADPEGMGASVGAPLDEYDDVAIRIISALSKAPPDSVPQEIVRGFYRDRRIAFDVSALWLAYDKPPEIEEPISFSWPVCIAEGWDFQAYENSSRLNTELEPWYGDLEGNLVWDATGKPLTIRRVGHPTNDMDGTIVVELAPNLEQRSLDEYLAEWLQKIDRPALAEFDADRRRAVAVAFALADHRLRHPFRGPIALLKRVFSRGRSTSL